MDGPGVLSRWFSSHTDFKDEYASAAHTSTACNFRPPAVAAEPEGAKEPYGVQPGDTLTVSVWKEEGLTGDVFVRPDGGLSFPLAGDISASGKSAEDHPQKISGRPTQLRP